jgi:hypothetical protein
MIYSVVACLTRVCITMLLTMVCTFLRAEENDNNLYLQRMQNTDQSTLAEAEERLEGYQKPDMFTDLKVPPFHKRDAVSITSDNSLCHSCHTAWPHRQSNRTRAMLNKHTARIACETCHLRPEKVPLTYAWWEMDTEAPIPADKNPFAKESKLASQRIVPLYQSQPALIFKSHPKAEALLKQWDSEQSTQGKARIHAAVHAPLTKEQTTCRSCHQSKQPLLDLEALGASKQQIDTVVNNPIANFFGRYKKEDEHIQILELLR